MCCFYSDGRANDELHVQTIGMYFVSWEYATSQVITTLSERSGKENLRTSKNIVHTNIINFSFLALIRHQADHSTDL